MERQEAGLTEDYDNWTLKISLQGAVKKIKRSIAKRWLESIWDLAIYIKSLISPCSLGLGEIFFEKNTHSKNLVHLWVAMYRRHCHKLIKKQTLSIPIDDSKVQLSKDACHSCTFKIRSSTL